MRILVLAIILSISTSSFAQLSIGLEGGFTRSRTHYGNAHVGPYRFSPINGFNGSIKAQYELTSFISLASTPGFVRRGMTHSAALPWPGASGLVTSPTKIMVCMDFLELPVLIQIDAWEKVRGKSKSQLIAGFGYSVGYMFRARERQFDLETLDMTESYQLAIGNNGRLQRIDQGLRWSLNLVKHYRTHQLYANLTCYYGLVDMEQFMRSKNRSLNINLGVLVPLRNSSE